MKPANIKLYLISLAGYTFISWVMLLRDPLALESIVNFYPQIGSNIFKLQSWALAHHLNTVPTIIFLTTVLLCFWAYFKLLQNIGQNTSHSFTKPLSITVLVAIITTLFSYPALSTDIFDYILPNRVITIYRQNPWDKVPNQFPNDPFINLGHYQQQISVYGPVFHLLTAPISSLAQNSFIGNILGIRLVNIAFLLSSLYFLDNISQSFKLTNRVQIIAALVLNPAVLIEFISQAHNDIIMIFFMIASLHALSTRRYYLAGLALGLGFHTKLFALTIFPFYLAYLIAQKKLLSAFQTLVAFIVTTFAGFALIGFDSMLNISQVTAQKLSLTINSFPNLFPFLPSYLFSLPFFAISFYIVSKKSSSLQTYLVKYSLVALIYLLFATSLYWPWYFIWVLPFALLTKATSLIKASLALSLTSTLSYPVLMFSHRFNYQLFAWTVLIYATIAIIPAYYLMVFIKNKN